MKLLQAYWQGQKIDWSILIMYIQLILHTLTSLLIKVWQTRYYILFGSGLLYKQIMLAKLTASLSSSDVNILAPLLCNIYLDVFNEIYCPCQTS